MAMINPRIKNTELRIKKRGFALLIAVIFMSVMLSFGLALGALGYKQQVLASAAIESQYAFYAADAALECALYADQGTGQNLFAYPPSDPPTVPAMTCDGAASIAATKSWSASQWIVTNRVRLDSNKRCADVTVYKPSAAGTTFLFSQGYDVSCDTLGTDARFVSRGISAHYAHY
jgi:Tfp pilus assembly protein PilX